MAGTGQVEAPVDPWASGHPRMRSGPARRLPRRG